MIIRIMNKAFFIFIIAALQIFSNTWASNNYWAEISELSKLGSPAGNPQLEIYLKNLTHKQMLVALRDCCSNAQRNIPKEKWFEVGLPATLILTYYGNENGGLSNDALDDLLIGIADNKEGLLFRQALISVLYGRYWSKLSFGQKEQVFDLTASILNEKEVPQDIRVLSCRELGQKLALDYRITISSDENVKMLKEKQEKRSSIFERLESGELHITAETKMKLFLLNEQINSYKDCLLGLLDDESQDVKKQAQKSLDYLKKLPLLDTGNMRPIINKKE